MQVQSSKTTESLTNASKGQWAGRWIWAAIIQGIIITAITVLIVEPLSFFNINWYFSPARVIAGGGGGTWMFTGYILYLVVGVVAVAVTALFYFYFEVLKGQVYGGVSNVLAWGHYVLWNVGVAGSMILMIWGGYMAGYSSASVASGGLGYSALQVHVNFLGAVEEPIGALVLVAALGALLGGVGFVLRSRQQQQKKN